MSLSASPDVIKDNNYTDNLTMNSELDLRKVVADVYMTLHRSTAYRSKHGEHDSFIKELNMSEGNALNVIMYTEHTMKMLKSAILSGSVIVIDHTYDLSPCFITILCFRNSNLLRSDRRNPPILLGPILIHLDRSFGSYLKLFTHLQERLGDIDQTNLVFGNDKELASVQAISKAFPTASMLMKGTNQLRLNHPVLVREWYAEKDLVSETKEISEVKKIPDIIRELFQIEQGQLYQLRAALMGQGDLELSEHSLKLKVSYHTWIAMCPEQRERRLNLLLNLSVNRKENLQLGANCVLVSALAEQQGARKRARTERLQRKSNKKCKH